MGRVVVTKNEAAERNAGSRNAGANVTVQEYSTQSKHRLLMEAVHMTVNKYLGDPQARKFIKWLNVGGGEYEIRHFENKAQYGQYDGKTISIADSAIDEWIKSGGFASHDATEKVLKMILHEQAHQIYDRLEPEQKLEGSNGWGFRYVTGNHDIAFFGILEVLRKAAGIRGPIEKAYFFNETGCEYGLIADPKTRSVLEDVSYIYWDATTAATYGSLLGRVMTIKRENYVSRLVVQTGKQLWMVTAGRESYKAMVYLDGERLELKLERGNEVIWPLHEYPLE